MTNTSAKTVLRVGVISPDGVSSERRAVVETIEELNRTLAAGIGFLLLLVGGDAIHDSIPADFDLLILIFSLFQTKTQIAPIGPASQLATSILSLLKNGCPELILFFATPTRDGRSFAVEQFRPHLPPPVLVVEYESDRDFQTKLRHALRDFLEKHYRLVATTRNDVLEFRAEKGVTKEQLTATLVSLSGYVQDRGASHLKVELKDCEQVEKEPVEYE